MCDSFINMVNSVECKCASPCLTSVRAWSCPSWTHTPINLEGSAAKHTWIKNQQTHKAVYCNINTTHRLTESHTCVLTHTHTVCAFLTGHMMTTCSLFLAWVCWGAIVGSWAGLPWACWLCCWPGCSSSEPWPGLTLDVAPKKKKNKEEETKKDGSLTRCIIEEEHFAVCLSEEVCLLKTHT